MKKLFVLAIAALAMTFVSCGNKAKAPEAEVVDTVAVADAAAEAEATINALAENLESKDLNAFQTALEAVKAKVAEFLANNPAIAQEYLSKVQGFLKENADKIKEFVGGNAAVATLVDGISAIPSETIEKLTGATDALKALGIDAAAVAGNAVEGAKDAAATRMLLPTLLTTPRTLLPRRLTLPLRTLRLRQVLPSTRLLLTPRRSWVSN